MFQQRVSILHLPLLLVLAGMTAWLGSGLYILFKPVPKLISDNTPTASASIMESEFVSNQLLIKVRANSKDKIKIDNLKATGLHGLDILNSKTPIKKFEQVGKENRKSKKDDPIFQWYLVTFDEPEERIKGTWDPGIKKLKTEHKDKTRLESRLLELSANSDIESAEPNYITYVSQADTEHPTAPTNLTISNLTSTSVSLTWGASTDNVGISKYLIFRNNVSNQEYSTTSLAYTDLKLAPNTSYTYAVVAQDTAGNLSSWSNVVEVNTPSSTPTVAFTPTPTLNIGSSSPQFTPTPSIGIGFSSPQLTPTPTPSHIPNDPYYASTGAWGQTYPDMWGMKRINAEGAWQQITNSDSIVVAVIDSGIDRNHPDISNNIWSNSGEIENNGIDDDQNGYVDDFYGWDFVNSNNNPTDDFGHGTSVAGVIGAVGNNGVGGVGVNWKTKIMNLRVLNSSGSGDWAHTIRALQYATDMGAEVINNSYGSVYSYRYGPLEDALLYAHSRGVVLVAGAGNNNINALDFIPASSPYAITVSAMDQNDQRSVWWNGYASNYGEKVDVSAPGSNVLAPASVCNPFINSRYCVVNGTSFSGPHTAGLAALMLGKNPSLTPEQVRQILRTSVTEIGTPGVDSYFGYGLINAGNAVAKSTQQVVTPFISFPQSKSAMGGTLPVVGSANGPTFSRYLVQMGQGRTPTTWYLLNASVTPVTNGTLATFNTANYPAGVYTFRLIAFDTNDFAYYFDMYDINLLPPPSTPTATPTTSISLTPTGLPLPTSTPTPTRMPTSTPVPTFTMTPTRTPTATPTQIPTATLTPTPVDLPPSVSITNPQSGSTVRRNSKVTIAATASDDRGIVKVEFRVNNTFLCIDSVSIYNCTWRVPSTRNVTYTIEARAYDTTGKVTNSTISVRAQ